MAAPSVTSRKLQVVQSDNPDGPFQTFVFQGEDHTLGNALKYIISKNPEVQFCGYTVPHPSENKIHFRIQTYGVPAVEILRQGLSDLHDISDHIEKTFKNSVVQEEI
uniref:DNA-directed RNA polymerases I and III subunit RPAC2 n=1 Tax=Strigamia maritima TaxID=126957 RepID=T1JBQ8_STRMM